MVTSTVKKHEQKLIYLKSHMIQALANGNKELELFQRERERKFHPLQELLLRTTTVTME